LLCMARHSRLRTCRLIDGQSVCDKHVKNKGSPYSITEHRVPGLIPVLGSQPAGDVSHKPDGRLPLLSARPAVPPATLKRAATNFAAWRREARTMGLLSHVNVGFEGTDGDVNTGIVGIELVQHRQTQTRRLQSGSFTAANQVVTLTHVTMSGSCNWVD